MPEGFRIPKANMLTLCFSLGPGIIGGRGAGIGDVLASFPPARQTAGLSEPPGFDEIVAITPPPKYFRRFCFAMDSVNLFHPKTPAARSSLMNRREPGAVHEGINTKSELPTNGPAPATHPKTKLKTPTPPWRAEQHQTTLLTSAKSLGAHTTQFRRRIVSRLSGPPDRLVKTGKGFEEWRSSPRRVSPRTSTQQTREIGSRLWPRRLEGPWI